MIDDRLRTRRARLACAATVALLVAGGAWLRLWGLDYLLPCVTNVDGLSVVCQVALFRDQIPLPQHVMYTDYPHLLARLAALWPAPSPAQGLGLEEQLRRAAEPWVQVRVVSVALSLLAIPGTYLLARRFLDRAGSLVAAGLLATSLFHITQSIQEKPHAAATTFVLLALLAALRLRRRPDVLSYLACGLAASLSVAALHNGAGCLPALAAAFLLRDRGARAASCWWILVPVAMVAASTVIFYPFYYGAGQGSDTAVVSLTQLGPLDFLLSLARGLEGGPVVPIVRALLGLDPLLVGLAAAGIAALGLRAFKDRARLRAALRGDLGVVLALALPYLLVLALFKFTLLRFLLPLLPLLACAAGFAFSRALEIGSAALRSVAARARLAAGLGAVLVLLAAAPATHFARIRARPDPLREAARWIEENADPDDRIAVIPYSDLPLFPTEEALAENVHSGLRSIWSSYLAFQPAQRLGEPRRPILIEPGDRPGSRVELRRAPLLYFRSFGARYAVIDCVGGGQSLLRGRADRVARFSPSTCDDGRDRGILLWGAGFDPLAPSLSSILRARSVGTTVEIFRLP